MAGKVWKLMKGRWAGITARGKRISIAKTKAQAESRAGIKSKSKASKPKTTRRKKSNPKRRVKRTGRKKKRRGGKSLSRTVMKWLRVAALVGPAPHAVLDPRWATPKDKFHVIMYRYTGFDMDTGKFDFRGLAEGWMPYIVTSLVTQAVPKISGIIRRI